MVMIHLLKEVILKPLSYALSFCSVFMLMRLRVHTDVILLFLLLFCLCLDKIATTMHVVSQCLIFFLL